MNNDLTRFRREFAREVDNHNYEQTEDGRLFFPNQKAFVGGMLMHTLNGADMQLDPNTFTTEGLNYLVSCGIKGGTQYSSWYVAPFSGNVTPATSLTAATFTATQTEATAYAESTRILYVGGTVASGSVSNSASRAEITANASVNVWGAGLLSASAKSATTGVLVACAKFSAVRALVSTDVLAFQYTLTLTAS